MKTNKDKIIDTLIIVFTGIIIFLIIFFLIQDLFF